MHKALFESQEIDRSIRPQQDVAVRKSKRGLSTGGMMGAVLFLAIVSGSGWFYFSGDDAPKKLKAVVEQGTEALSDITDKVTSSISEMGQAEPETTVDSDARDVRNEEAMVRLRERLQSIRAEATQKEKMKFSVVPAVVMPAVVEPAVPDIFPEETTIPVLDDAQNQDDVQTEKPVTEIMAEIIETETVETEATNRLETVDDVMRALNAPEAIVETADTGLETTSAAVTANDSTMEEPGDAAADVVLPVPPEESVEDVATPRDGFNVFETR